MACRARRSTSLARGDRARRRSWPPSPARFVGRLLLVRRMVGEAARVKSGGVPRSAAHTLTARVRGGISDRHRDLRPVEHGLHRRDAPGPGRGARTFAARLGEAPVRRGRRRAARTRRRRSPCAEPHGGDAGLARCYVALGPRRAVSRPAGAAPPAAAHSGRGDRTPGPLAVACWSWSGRSPTSSRTSCS